MSSAGLPRPDCRYLWNNNNTQYYLGERERLPPRNVQDSACDWDGSPEAHDLIQVIGRHLRVVPLEVGEVEVVGKSLLGPGEPHWLQQGLAAVIKGDDELQLGPTFFLLHT